MESLYDLSFWSELAHKVLPFVGYTGGAPVVHYYGHCIRVKLYRIGLFVLAALHGYHNCPCDCPGVFSSAIALPRCIDAYLSHIIFQAVSFNSMTMVSKRVIYQVTLFNAFVTCNLTFFSLLSTNSYHACDPSFDLSSWFSLSFSMRTEVSACIIQSRCSSPPALTVVALCGAMGAVPRHSLGL
jgi:hypothetical protein